MKVSLKPGTEKRGLILKSEIHTVRLTVQMTEEEKAAARAANILNQELFAVPLSEKSNSGPIFTVNELVKGVDVTGHFADFLSASEFSSTVKDMLVKVKTALEAKMNEGDEEFEL